MEQDDLQAQFDAWAQTYDQEVQSATGGFPFAGYAQALDTLFAEAKARPGMRVLDLGVGTGNLARPFVAASCEVVGVDFSTEMLARTRAKLPEMVLAQVDLTAAEWPPEMNGRFERIVSNYVFHEFPWDVKLDILERLAADHLAEDGRILLGDVMFPTAADLTWARVEHAEQWDEEHFWLADEAQATLQQRGWIVEYRPTSFCAGVLLLRPPAPT